jgi:hypothetical protein
VKRRASGYSALDRIAHDGSGPEMQILAAAILIQRDEIARLNEELTSLREQVARTQRHVDLEPSWPRETVPAEALR